MAGGLLSPDIDMAMAALLLIAILIFTLVFEDLIQRLERRLESLEHYMAVLDKVYRELMILGFISLGVVFANEFSLIHNHDNLISFEFSHLLIFGVSLYYVMTAVVACQRLHVTSLNWKRIANAETDNIVDRAEEAIANNQGSTTGFGPCWGSIFSFKLGIGPNTWHDLQYRGIRLMFLKEFNLGTEFDYSTYVTTKLYAKLGHSLHVHPSTWSLVMLIALLFWVLKTLVGSDDHAGDEHDRRRRLGGAAPKVGNATDVPPDETSMLLSILIPSILGWFLMLTQCIVLWSVNHALIRMFKFKGCKCANDISKYVRDLDAELEIQHMLPLLVMFKDCGQDFLGLILENCEKRFYKPGEIIFSAGDASNSVLFICKGYVDVYLANGSVAGQLSPGDYTGEAALLGDSPRPATQKARTRCVIFELPSTAMEVIAEAYPAAVQQMLDFALQRQEAATKGLWSRTPTVKARNVEDKVKEHAERLAQLKRAQEAKQNDPEMKLNAKALLLATANPLTAGKKLAKGLKGVASSPLTAAKKAAAAVGVPGTGIAKPHSTHAHHQHLERMEGAEEIMPSARTHFFEEINEITLLLNCFSLGYYSLHLMPVIIPIQCGGSAVGYIFCHVAVLLPALLLMFIISPTCSKFSCLLDNVLHKDQDTIAEVYHGMTQLISEKNAIKKQLMKVGMVLAHDVGIADDDVEIGAIAEMIFNDLDTDGDGFLTYNELRLGLTDYRVYLSKKEFKKVMECIDPDFSGTIELDEWVQFLRASDEQLANNEWREFNATMAVRKRLSAELIRKVIECDLPQQSVMPEDIMTQIFEEMDTDKSETLSFQELKEGMHKYGISMSETDLSVISQHINKEGTNGELTLGQWKDFTRARDVPPPGDSMLAVDIEPPSNFEDGVFEVEGMENPLAGQGTAAGDLEST